MRRVAIAVLGLVSMACCASGVWLWRWTGGGVAGPAWTLTLDGLDTVLAEGNHAVVVLSHFPGAELRTIDLATGATLGMASLEPGGLGNTLARQEDPEHRHVVFVETDATAQAVVAIQTVEPDGATHRFVVPPGTRTEAVAVQAGLVLVVIPDGAVAYRADGSEAFRIELAGARTSSEVWNESSHTVSLEDASGRAFLYDAATGAPLETFETRSGDLVFLTDHHVLELDDGGVRARVRGGAPDPVLVPGARAWIVGDDWIAFCGATGLAVRHTDLTPFGAQAAPSCTEHLDRAGDRITLVGRDPAAPVQTYDVRTGMLHELGSVPVPFVARIFGVASAPLAFSTPHVVLLRQGNALYGMLAEP